MGLTNMPTVAAKPALALPAMFEVAAVSPTALRPPCNSASAESGERLAAVRPSMSTRRSTAAPLPGHRRRPPTISRPPLKQRPRRVQTSGRVGMVHINDAPAHGVGHFPFGGCKPDSGIGREGLGYSIDEVTILKTVVMPG